VFKNTPDSAEYPVYRIGQNVRKPPPIFPVRKSEEKVVFYIKLYISFGSEGCKQKEVRL
jgi:hypothetical protein